MDRKIKKLLDEYVKSVYVQYRIYIYLAGNSHSSLYTIPFADRCLVDEFLNVYAEYGWPGLYKRYSNHFRPSDYLDVEVKFSRLNSGQSQISIISVMTEFEFCTRHDSVSWGNKPVSGYLEPSAPEGNRKLYLYVVADSDTTINNMLLNVLENCVTFGDLSSYINGRVTHFVDPYITPSQWECDGSQVQQNTR